ncbi:MAG: hypothetical protein L0K86_10970 [Actinomycetia bacterium]|nr:hypothetical protein [Actinomycetes bacterium]
MTGTILTTRNATVADLAAVLQARHASEARRRHPRASPRRRQRPPAPDRRRRAPAHPEGVTVGETVLRPTAVADAGIAEKLGIPLPYLRRLRAEQIGLYDANVNTWLGDDPDRRFLVRGLHDPDGGTGRRAGTGVGLLPRGRQPRRPHGRPGRRPRR